MKDNYSNNGKIESWDEEDSTFINFLNTGKKALPDGEEVVIEAVSFDGTIIDWGDKITYICKNNQ